MSGDDGAAAPAEEIVQLCAFLVGGEELVVDLMRVKDIVAPLPLTRVPHAPEPIEGVIHLRGAVVPVVDVRRRLGLPRLGATRKAKVLICTVGGRRLGLCVDAVTEVLRIPRSQIRPAPAMLTRGRPGLFAGVCGPPERLKLLLDIKALLVPGGAPPAEAGGAGERGR